VHGNMNTRKAKKAEFPCQYNIFCANYIIPWSMSQLWTAETASVTRDLPFQAHMQNSTCCPPHEDS
jgi:hypothetical protein